MQIEILDIHTARPLTIDGETVLGRQGTGADIEVADNRVSGRHARIFAQNGHWFLEDLNSSNGTFVKGVQVNKPIELKEGMGFALCEYSFQVLRILGDGGVAVAQAEPAPTVGGNSNPSQSPRNAGFEFQGTEPGGPQARGGGVNRSTDASMGGTNGRVTAGDSGGFMGSLMGAFGYYVVASPAMLFNPIGTNKKAMEEMRFPAMTGKELIPWFMVPYFLGGVLFGVGGLITGIIAMIRTKTFSVSPFITPIIVPIVFAISGLIGALLFHPILKFFIKLFKGESDELNRTNYGMVQLTALPVLFLAMGIGATLAGLGIPFLPIVSPLLTGAAYLILVWIVYNWWKDVFRVIKIIPILVLIGGIAMGALSLLSVPGIIKGGIAQIKAGGSGGSGLAGGTDGGGGSGGGSVNITPDQVPAKYKAKFNAAMSDIASRVEKGTLTEAQAEAERAQVMALLQKAIERDNAAAGTPTPSATPTAMAGGTDGGTAGGTDGGTDGGSAGMSGGTDGGTSGGTDPFGSGGTDVGMAGGSGMDSFSYSEYVRKRAAIEAALAANPALINDESVEKLYREMHRRTYDVEKSYRVQGATPVALAKRKVNEHKIAAETYDKCKDIVDRLYSKISG